MEEKDYIAMVVVTLHNYPYVFAVCLYSRQYIVRIRVTVTLRTVGSHAVRIASKRKQWVGVDDDLDDGSLPSRVNRDSANYDTSSEIYRSLFPAFYTPLRKRRYKSGGYILND